MKSEKIQKRIIQSKEFPFLLVLGLKSHSLLQHGTPTYLLSQKWRLYALKRLFSVICIYEYEKQLQSFLPQSQIDDSVRLFFQDFFPDFFNAYLGLLFITEVPCTFIYFLIFPPACVSILGTVFYIFRNQSTYIARYGSPPAEVLLLSNLIFLR